MDLLKLFALLVAVATVRVSAEGPKKKIRIHLPQKVKHIHHHKKIYITNHPASSQYAPAYTPSAEGSMAVAAAAAPVGGLVPVHSVEMYLERAPSASQLLPLYRARGYYGPNAADWDDQEYDLSPPPEPTQHSYSTAFSGSSPPLHYQKKINYVKLNEPKKKAVRKGKPKRVPPRIKPQLDEEIPVSPFHEQFYSDLDGSTTLKKVRKPHRVEKIIDGDTEHIHTYSEEHVHKLVYDDGTAKLIGVDPAAELAPSRHVFPMKSSLLALSPEALTGLATMGSMGTPPHLEYAAYNPGDVTHDHIFHDHGEIPSYADVPKENLPYAPKVSYNNFGIAIGGHGSKGHRKKFPLQSYSKPTKPTGTNDYSYYENIYSPSIRTRPSKPTNPSSLYNPPTEAPLDHYRPIPSFDFRNKANLHSRVVPELPFGNQAADYRTQQTSVGSPFAAISSTVVHDYKPKIYPSQASSAFDFNKNRNTLQSRFTSNLDFDPLASAPSNLYTSEDKFNPSLYPGKRGKKKSISTQNIRIGGLDHQSTVDHLLGSGLTTFLNDGVPTALDFDQNKQLGSATSTPYTIRESSLVHPYYTAMAAKALHGEDGMQGESSNTNFQYAEAPTTELSPVATTNSPLDNFQENTELVSTDTAEDLPKKTKDIGNHSNVLKDTRQRYTELEANYKISDRPMGPSHKAHRKRKPHSQPTESTGNMGSRKYGDKI